MSIKTTINIRLEILSKIADSAKDLNISLNKLISLLFIRMIHDKMHKIMMFKPVKYQETGDEIIYHKLHIALSSDLYEKALDLRKVLKMSVSLIIAKAVDKYLQGIVDDVSRTGRTDNYFRSYVFIPNFHMGVLYFTIFWQFPSSILLQKFIK